jgi:hypothetical protein
VFCGGFFLSLIFLLLGQPLTGIINAKGNNYISNALLMGYNVINWGGLLWLASARYPFKYLSLPQLAAAIAWLLALFYYALQQRAGKRGVPGIPRLSRANIQPVVRLLKPLGRLYLSAVAGLLNEPLIKIITVQLFGFPALAHADIFFKIKNQFQAVISKALESTGFYFAREKELQKIKEYINRLQKILLYLILPALTIVYFNIAALLSKWIHSFSAIDVQCIKWGIICFFAGLYTLPFFIYLIYSNRLRYAIFIQLTGALVSVVALLCCYRLAMPVYAVYTAVTLGMIAAWGNVVYLQYTLLDIRVKDYFPAWPDVGLNGLFLLGCGWLSAVPLLQHNIMPRLFITALLYLLLFIAPKYRHIHTLSLHPQ